MTVFYLAIALAMDAFALSIALGSIHKKGDYKIFGLKAAFIFGFFQGFLFLLGNIIGLVIKSFLLSFLKYISFIMLLLVALKMLYEFIKGEEVEEVSNKGLLVTGIFVSIDACVTGVAFAYYDLNLTYAVLLISLITFSLSLVGFIIAKYLRKLEIIEKYSLLLSSIILFLLALKVIIK